MTMLHTLAEVSFEVRETSQRNRKIGLLSSFLKQLEPEEHPIGIALLTGDTFPRKLGIGWKRISKLAHNGFVGTPTLQLRDVGETFEAVAEMSGPGSQQRRMDRLSGLRSQCTSMEWEFLSSVLSGGLRQGANEGVLLSGVARASEMPLKDLRRAWMFAGNLAAVAHAALSGGVDAVQQFTLTHFQPIKPMLAGTADSADEAFISLGPSYFETKLDGVRVQIHRHRERVKVYSRSLRDLTSMVPEVVEFARSLPVESLVLDGEVLACRPNGFPRPFQETMRRFGRVHDIDARREELPLSVYAFDCLELNGRVLVDEPFGVRKEQLDRVVPERHRTGGLQVQCPEDARSFYLSVLELGHEGIIAKGLGGTYQAGSRTGGWIKVKPSHTLDLVVLAAEWGSGRRKGWLSNLHLGARAQDNTFVMLGKTFKGLTDDILRWQTGALLERETQRRGQVVYVRPELIVEVAFSDVQASTQYDSGMALRFARVRQYRNDLVIEDIDTLETVQRLHVTGHRS